MSEKQEITAPDLTVSIPQKWEDQGYIAWSKPVTNGEKFAPNIVISRSFLEKDQMEVSQRQVYIQRKDRSVVNVTFSTAGGDFEMNEELFNEILDSLELLEKE